MDVSLLDEKPPGRTPVTTALVSSGRMDEVVAHLAQAMAEGRQAYWVCPLVEESEVSDLTAAPRSGSSGCARRWGRGGGARPRPDAAGREGRRHGAVRGRATKVLVATTVIEVGVNVPNASIMVIERAESFGLAQLHQLRGRVGRGAAASTCLLMYQPPLGETARRRLEILRETEDGFRIAEEDLAMRGRATSSARRSRACRGSASPIWSGRRASWRWRRAMRGRCSRRSGTDSARGAGGADAPVAHGAGQGDPADLGRVGGCVHVCSPMFLKSSLQNLAECENKEATGSIRPRSSRRCSKT
jgi:hypothetical protein